MTNKIDKRKSYFVVFDTETANGLDDPIMYDLGFAVVDKKGTVYETNSLIIREVFYGMKDLMKSAYYADKIPNYEKEIANGQRKVVSLYEAKKIFQAVCKKYNVKACIAHNADLTIGQPQKHSVISQNQNTDFSFLTESNCGIQ